MNTMSGADSVVVLDFETTGMSPDRGDRAIEVGAVRIERGEIVARFEELMNPDRRVNGFIQNLTGINNQMLECAPPCSDVMAKFADFIDGYNLVAHNASFDKRFLDAELTRIGMGYSGEFVCSMLTARRVYPQAPNHKLGTLIQYKNLQGEGSSHRALYDAEMTAQLWLGMLEEIRRQHRVEHIPFSLVKKLSKSSIRRPSGLPRQVFRRY